MRLDFLQMPDSIARLLSTRRGAAADSALILPRANLAEASLVSTLSLAAPETLAELVGWLRRGGALPAPSREAASVVRDDAVDFADVAG